jgi:16S rRNA (cytosine1402-N4)-methyltransferase
MSLSAANPCYFPRPSRAAWTVGLRRWLDNVLFLHLDLWPWQLASGPARMLTMNSEPDRGGHGPSEQREPPASSRFEHATVLLHEAVDLLRPAPGKLVVDATMGGAGHTLALLEAGANVLGFDQDEAAIEAAHERCADYEDRFATVRANFRELESVLQESGVGLVDGILADIGVSSFQLDTAERGFSFQQDGPLEMRMDQRTGITAADIVNTWSVEELQKLFVEYGEEPLARRAAMAILRRREQRPFHRTLDLAEVLAAALPRRGKTHPATRVFQALRIAVNDELGALKDLLDQAPRCLKPGGRLVMISFHSLEDRIVKHTLQKQSTQWQDRPEWPEPRPNPDYCMRVLTKKPVEPSEEEISRNPRSRSARLRAAERIVS